MEYAHSKSRLQWVIFIFMPNQVWDKVNERADNLTSIATVQQQTELLFLMLLGIHDRPKFRGQAGFYVLDPTTVIQGVAGNACHVGRKWHLITTQDWNCQLCLDGETEDQILSAYKFVPHKIRVIRWLTAACSLATRTFWLKYGRSILSKVLS